MAEPWSPVSGIGTHLLGDWDKALAAYEAGQPLRVGTARQWQIRTQVMARLGAVDPELAARLGLGAEQVLSQAYTAVLNKGLPDAIQGAAAEWAAFTKAHGMETVIPDSLLDTVASRSAQAITADWDRLYSWQQENIAGILAQGSLLGKNPREVAALLRPTMAVAAGRSQFRAMNIARTEMLDARDHVTYDLMKRDGIQAYKWRARDDGCPICLINHNRMFNANEFPSRHHQCRCVIIPLTDDQLADLADAGHTLGSGNYVGPQKPRATILRALPKSWRKALPTDLRQLVDLRPNAGWRPSWKIVRPSGGIAPKLPPPASPPAGVPSAWWADRSEAARKALAQAFESCDGDLVNLALTHNSMPEHIAKGLVQTWCEQGRLMWRMPTKEAGDAWKALTNEQRLRLGQAMGGRITTREALALMDDFPDIPLDTTPYPKPNGIWSFKNKTGSEWEAAGHLDAFEFKAWQDINEQMHGWTWKQAIDAPSGGIHKMRTWYEGVTGKPHLSYDDHEALAAWMKHAGKDVEMPKGWTSKPTWDAMDLQQRVALRQAWDAAADAQQWDTLVTLNKAHITAAGKGSVPKAKMLSTVKQAHGVKDSPSLGGKPRAVAKQTDDPASWWATPNGLTDTKKSLGGAHTKYVLKDKDGNLWMFKPQDDWRSLIDVSTARLTRKAGLDAPDITVGEWQGQRGAFHYLYPDSGDTFAHKGVTLDEMTPQQVQAVQQHMILDWLMGNHDGHFGNFVTTKDGRIVGIDKGQAFKFYRSDRLDLGYNPNESFGETPAWQRLLPQLAKDPSKAMSRQQQAAFIRRIQAIPDDDVRTLFRPYAESTATRLGYSDADEMLDDILDRRDRLDRDVDAVYKQADVTLPEARTTGPLGLAEEHATASDPGSWIAVDYKDAARHYGRGVKEYTSIGYADINNALRKGDDLSRTIQRQVRDIDAALHPVKKPVVVTRETGNPAWKSLIQDDPDGFVGRIIGDDGYMSTTADPRGKGFGELTLKITVRPEHGNVGVWAEEVTSVKGEDEFILRRGIRLYVSKVETKTDYGTSRYVIHCEVVDNDWVAESGRTVVGARLNTPLSSHPTLPFKATGTKYAGSSADRILGEVPDPPKARPLPPSTSHAPTLAPTEDAMGADAVELNGHLGVPYVEDGDNFITTWMEDAVADGDLDPDLVGMWGEVLDHLTPDEADLLMRGDWGAAWDLDTFDPASLTGDVVVMVRQALDLLNDANTASDVAEVLRAAMAAL